MPYTQTYRHLAISTPLGNNVLLLRGFNGSEAISQPFNFDLDLLSESDSIKFQDVVGKNVTLSVFGADGKERLWNGFISRFSQGAHDGRLTTYRAQMVPWLWFLTRTADCRIFQNKAVPDIIKQIFGELKFHDFELRLYGDFPVLEYCVQYRETDFNFVSRLMEREGICYYFDHQSDKHIMILSNNAVGHKACPNQETAQYGISSKGNTVSGDLVTEWNYYEEFHSGAWAQTDYNFQTPSISLAVSVKGSNPYEIYEYPGEHSVRSEGDRISRIRLEEQSILAAVNRGVSTCRHFISGFKFTLNDHYRTDLNSSYLLTSINHSASTGGTYESGVTGDELTYQNSFQCIPFSTQFRPPRVTPEPFVQGCQTAVVCGPAGQEIHTDTHGRIKVQFHWDREGKKNENSSCWIRVSHPWAGKGYGSVSIPRIGQEVVVDFLEGDPDKPIIIGRVYNAEQTAHIGLPAAAMVSGIKSNSTPGGGGSNEMTMDDTKGKEKINIHAQYDMLTKVEHDESLTVIHDRTKQIDNDETNTIKNNRTTEITKGAEKLTVKAGSRDVTVHVNDTKNVETGFKKDTIKGPYDITVNTGHFKIVCGASSLILNQSGLIEIKGTDITLHADAHVKIEGSNINSDAKVSHNISGTLVVSDGKTVNIVKGGMVQLNP